MDEVTPSGSFRAGHEEAVVHGPKSSTKPPTLKQRVDDASRSVMQLQKLVWQQSQTLIDAQVKHYAPQKINPALNALEPAPETKESLVEDLETLGEEEFEADMEVRLSREGYEEIYASLRPQSDRPKAQIEATITLRDDQRTELAKTLAELESEVTANSNPKLKTELLKVKQKLAAVDESLKEQREILRELGGAVDSLIPSLNPQLQEKQEKKAEITRNKVVKEARPAVNLKEGMQIGRDAAQQSKDLSKLLSNISQCSKVFDKTIARTYASAKPFNTQAQQTRIFDVAADIARFEENLRRIEAKSPKSTELVWDSMMIKQYNTKVGAVREKIHELRSELVGFQAVIGDQAQQVDLKNAAPVRAAVKNIREHLKRINTLNAGAILNFALNDFDVAQRAMNGIDKTLPYGQLAETDFLAVQFELNAARKKYLTKANGSLKLSRSESRLQRKLWDAAKISIQKVTLSAADIPILERLLIKQVALIRCDSLTEFSKSKASRETFATMWRELDGGTQAQLLAYPFFKIAYAHIELGDLAEQRAIVLLKSEGPHRERYLYHNEVVKFAKMYNGLSENALAILQRDRELATDYTQVSSLGAYMTPVKRSESSHDRSVKGVVEVTSSAPPGEGVRKRLAAIEKTVQDLVRTTETAANRDVVQVPVANASKVAQIQATDIDQSLKGVRAKLKNLDQTIAGSRLNIVLRDLTKANIEMTRLRLLDTRYYDLVKTEFDAVKAELDAAAQKYLTSENALKKLDMVRNRIQKQLLVHHEQVVREIRSGSSPLLPLLMKQIAKLQYNRFNLSLLPPDCDLNKVQEGKKKVDDSRQELSTIWNDLDPGIQRILRDEFVFFTAFGLTTP